MRTVKPAVARLLIAVTLTGCSSVIAPGQEGHLARDHVACRDPVNVWTLMTGRDSMIAISLRNRHECEIIPKGTRFRGVELSAEFPDVVGVQLIDRPLPNFTWIDNGTQPLGQLW